MKPFEVDQVLEALWAEPFRDKLSSWESDFLASVTAQWEQTRSLSDKQHLKLDEIWEGFASGKRR